MEPNKKIFLEEKIKKSELKAKSNYDYKRLIFPKQYLIPMDLEENKEEITFRYEVEHLTCFTNIRKETSIVQLAILISTGALFEAIAEYAFCIHPDNLYYDVNGQVRIKQRDVYERGSETEEKIFLDSYKALVGYAWQKRYSFEDYLQGGKNLYSKKTFLYKISKLTNLEDIQETLAEQSSLIKEDMRTKKLIIGKKSVKRMKAAIVLMIILLLGAGTYIGYQEFQLKPFQKAVIESDNAYIASDYIGVIDALSELAPDKLPISQQYILATSYIKSENLTLEQKENILSKISLQGDTSLFRYWIYIGRLNTSEATNIAMQLSDDELLLYSYMKEKSQIETDASITGEEKSKSLSDIDSKIKPLTEKYMNEEK